MTSPTRTPSALRALANAIDELDKMLVFTNDTMPKDGDMHARVEWQFGSSCTGYTEMRGRVERLVNARLPTIFDEAIRAQEMLVAELRKQVFGDAS